MLNGAQEAITESTNLEEVTQEITSGVSEMALGAEQINMTVDKAHEISGRMCDGIDSLMKEVSRCKVG